MAHVLVFNPRSMKATICLYFLILTSTFLISNAARILDEVDPQEPQIINDLPLPLRDSDTTNVEAAANADPPVPEVEAPAADNISVSPVESPTNDEDQQQPQPVAKEPSLSFFMHDILAVTGSNNQPFVSAGKLPGRFTVQKLMFDSVIVIDDQLTEGYELDSGVVGRAQGFYTASSLDGTSQSVVMTLLLHGGEVHGGVEDSISLFGVHRTASLKSEVAVIGGSGKYENARGYATLETGLKKDQHTTDGVDTILHFNIYLTH